ERCSNVVAPPHPPLPNPLRRQLRPRPRQRALATIRALRAPRARPRQRRRDGHKLGRQLPRRPDLPAAHACPISRRHLRAVRGRLCCGLGGRVEDLSGDGRAGARGGWGVVAEWVGGRREREGLRGTAEGGEAGAILGRGVV
ncbi:hypothetical protein LTR16_004586, partial [Cryomyces antarcticus]